MLQFTQQGTEEFLTHPHRNGMEPLATLHHFVHPEWYERLGAFEKEENLGLFLAWVRLAFE